jgi:hypothetical protein
VPVIVGSDVLAGPAAERVAPASADPVVKMRTLAMAASKKNGVRLMKCLSVVRSPFVAASDGSTIHEI